MGSRLQWMLHGRKSESNMWVVEKYISKRTCNMDTFGENYFNLNIDLIFLILSLHIKKMYMHLYHKDTFTSTTWRMYKKGMQWYYEYYRRYFRNGTN